MGNLGELVRGFVAGEKTSAFKTFDQYEGQIDRYIRKLARPEDAQDILSHVRIAFCDRIDTLRDRNQVKNFLFQITRDEIRRHWLRYSRTADLEETVRSDTNSPQTELLAAERLNALRDCLKRIEDPVTRDVGQLRFRQYLRLEDISNQIHLSLDQVKRRVAKVKKLVTDCMRAKFGDQLP